MYEFLDELERNAEYLCLWGTHNEQQATDLDHIPIPLISAHWASAVTERWKLQGNGLEQQLRGFTLESVDAANYLNAEIERFNQEHPRTEERLSRRKVIAEL